MAVEDENRAQIRILTLINAFTWECLEMDGAQSFRGLNVANVVRCWIESYGMPQHIPSKKGPEFAWHSLRTGLRIVNQSRLDPFRSAVGGRMHIRWSLQDSGQLYGQGSFSQMMQAKAVAVVVGGGR